MIVYQYNNYFWTVFWGFEHWTLLFAVWSHWAQPTKHGDFLLPFCCIKAFIKLPYSWFLQTSYFFNVSSSFEGCSMTLEVYRPPFVNIKPGGLSTITTNMLLESHPPITQPHSQQTRHLHIVVTLLRSKWLPLSLKTWQLNHIAPLSLSL